MVCTEDPIHSISLWQFVMTGTYNVYIHVAYCPRPVSYVHSDFTAWLPIILESTNLRATLYCEFSWYCSDKCALEP